MAHLHEKNRDSVLPAGLGWEYNLRYRIPWRQGSSVCRARRGLYVTLRNVHASIGDVGGEVSPAVGFSPAGKEGSW
jgi:hypothetical protein